VTELGQFGSPNAPGIARRRLQRWAARRRVRRLPTPRPSPTSACVQRRAAGAALQSACCRYLVWPKGLAVVAVAALSVIPTDCILICDFMPTKGVTTFVSLKWLAEVVPSRYTCFIEERETAVELYHWWSKRMAGAELFREIKTIDDVEGLIRTLSGYDPGDRV
jgi:hypothetical protein